MKVSVIMIGRNCASTIEPSWRSVVAAIGVAGDRIEQFQLLYVDGNSTDDSVSVARSVEGVDVIEIRESTFFSAALGRYIGMCHAEHDCLLFMDGDMTLAPRWFVDSQAAFAEHGAVVGRWTERRLDSADGSVIAEIENYNRIKSAGPILRPCGFLQIHRSVPNERAHFHPLVINNEEKDFYAQFLSTHRIHWIDADAFTHHNFTSPSAKWKAYTGRYTKTGYLVSAFYAIQGGYLAAYLQINRDKAINLVVVLSWAIAIAIQNGWLLFAVSWLLLFPLAKLKSRIADLLVLPYKLWFAVWLLSKRQQARYVIDGCERIIDIRATGLPRLGEQRCDA